MITFVYVTCRREPKFEWFIDSLHKQANELNVSTSLFQLVFVDYELQYDETRRQYLESIVNARFSYVHVSPKPSPIQGRYRLTEKNYFSAGSARNTGICYAKYDYVAFIDDTSVMMPGSLLNILDYARNQLVVGFAYKKVHKLDVRNGSIVSMVEHPGGIDSRFNIGDSFRKISGSQLWGFTASPLKVLLSVNGYDEICNTIGGEDYHYGLRIEKTSVPIYYSKYVVFIESEELADQGNTFIRIDPLLEDSLYNELLKQYEVINRWDPNGRKDVSHLVLDLLTRNKSWTEGNDYHLTDLRNKILNGGEFINTFFPEISLFYGKKIIDL